MGDDRPIGIFDSGMGGLTLVQSLLEVLGEESLIYFGDTAHLPYGQRSLDEIRVFSREIVAFLLAQGAKAIVVACNTATAAAVNQLRAEWPGIPFFGMEPAVKPAAAATESGVVGVLATQGTFRSQRYADLMMRYGRQVQMLENPCIGLVARIEAGALQAQETEAQLREILAPMLAKGADTFVLGCTHYPFVRTQIEKIVGPKAHIIDPALAVAEHLQRRLHKNGLLASPGHVPQHKFFASGDASSIQFALQNTLKLPEKVEQVTLAN
ncbi:MAG TPA: glutamate racemase [Bacteroidetes bacterium]|nr:glutamate racemase [Bacteroidota bacterium]